MEPSHSSQNTRETGSTSSASQFKTLKIMSESCYYYFLSMHRRPNCISQGNGYTGYRGNSIPSRYTFNEMSVPDCRRSGSSVVLTTTTHWRLPLHRQNHAASEEVYWQMTWALVKLWRLLHWFSVTLKEESRWLSLYLAELDLHGLPDTIV